MSDRVMSWSWQGYVLKDYSFVDFTPGTLVMDVGCGSGMELQELSQRGCLAIGIDVDRGSLANCQRSGLEVLQACAEQMPVKNESIDGLICKGVIPYTDVPKAFSEIGRVLRPGAVGYCCNLSAGYYLRYLLLGPSWKFRFYGLRTLVNTWLYAVTGRRLPGFLGDTIYQSRPRLEKHYQENGLCLLQDCPARSFLGLPVFIYQTIQKVTS
jgi:SAM-dependent methyltransferase